jgi:hypothetical protein
MVRYAHRYGSLCIALCRDRKLSGFLEQPPELGFGRQAHSSICVQEGDPVISMGYMIGPKIVRKFVRAMEHHVTSA